MQFYGPKLILTAASLEGSLLLQPTLHIATHRQLQCLWVMQVVQQASRLEALYVNLVDPSEDDYQLLASLPALRKLAIASGCIHETCGRGAAVRCQAQQALPHVSVVKADAVLFECEAFFRWALE